LGWPEPGFEEETLPEKITQIALEIGYESQSHFTSLFKRLVGVTPKSYREQV
jgi:AraC family transcriptional regulator